MTSHLIWICKVQYNTVVLHYGILDFKGPICHDAASRYSLQQLRRNPLSMMCWWSPIAAENSWFTIINAPLWAISIKPFSACGVGFLPGTDQIGRKLIHSAAPLHPWYKKSSGGQGKDCGHIKDWTSVRCGQNGGKPKCRYIDPCDKTTGDLLMPNWSASRCFIRPNLQHISVRRSWSSRKRRALWPEITILPISSYIWWPLLTTFAAVDFKYSHQAFHD